MRFIYAIVLGLYLSFSMGCSTAAGTNSLWTQCIRADGWGLAWISEFGIMYFGRLNWTRNIACDKVVAPEKPSLPAGVSLP
jgi:hypothetical protein